MTMRLVASLFLLCFALLAQPWPIAHHHEHVQGIDATDRWFWISAVDRRTKTGWVWRVDRRTMATVAERNITDGARFHPGGLQVVGDRLWAPVAEYRPSSSARILELDAMTLAERRSFEAPDHIGSVATDGRTAVLGGNWDSRKIYRWSLEGKLLESVDLREPIAIQDFKWLDGTLYAGGLGRDQIKGQCLLEELNPATLEILRRFSPPDSPICYAHEGMARWGDQFFFLPEDEPRSQVYVISSRSLKERLPPAPR